MRGRNKEPHLLPPLMHARQSARLLFFAALASATLTAPVDAQSPAPGLRVFGPLTTPMTWLVDPNGEVVHTWISDYPAGTGCYLLEDGSLLRSARTVTPIGAGGEGGTVQRLGFDSTVLWQYDYQSGGVLSHHDIEPMPNGNVLLIAWEEKTMQETIDAGRIPLLIDPNGAFLPDHIVEIEPTGPTTGNIVWEWHVWDHLIQDYDSTKANYGVVADHPELIDINYPIEVPNRNDWNHMNGVHYDPVHDWILLSPRQQQEIWVIDHSTTTAEAAGHTGGNHGKGGDILYRWGNPLAYRRGTPDDQQLFFAHAPVFVPPGYPGEGNILVFSNQHPGGSAVLELVPPIDGNGDFFMDPSGVFGPSAPVWGLQGPGFQSNFVSNAERLPNGNTLVCSGQEGNVFEVDPSGTPVFFFDNPTTANFVFHAHYYEHHFWANRDELSVQNGGIARLDLIAGTPHAGKEYIILGSLAGRSPGFPIGALWMPLNPDAYFFSTIVTPDDLFLRLATGVLDDLGKAKAYFHLPAGILPPQAIGLTFDHAFVAIDPTTGSIDLASNATSITLTP